MRNKITRISLLTSLLAYLLTASRVSAMCPVCTVGVIAGLGLSRWLGIDDTVSGLWIGGVTVSLSGWTVNWLKGKKINFKGMPIAVAVVYFASIIIPLYWKEIIGHPFNKLWGIDKLILGIMIGSIFFLLGAIVYKYIKLKNNGHAWFPFQKVVFPIGPLIILSVIFYFITKH